MTGFKQINPFPHKICNSWTCLQIIGQLLYFFSKPSQWSFISCPFLYSDISDKCKYFGPFFSFSLLFSSFSLHTVYVLEENSEDKGKEKENNNLLSHPLKNNFHTLVSIAPNISVSFSRALCFSLLSFT